MILAKTIKGYGLGAAAEGRNIAHQAKKLTGTELRDFRDRLGIPIARRRPRGHAVLPAARRQRGDRRTCASAAPRSAAPCRAGSCARSRSPRSRRDLLDEFRAGNGDREVATTQVLVSMLRRLMSDPALGRLIVPIVPDEARTFGMDSLFRKFGIYSQQGQRYEPVDSDIVAYYREAEDGQLLEEGITEAGAMASFTAAGTAYAAHGVNTIPFFLFYSMFGFQRIGDLDLGSTPTRAARASSSAAPPGARRSPARACSTRTATATCSRAPCRPCAPTIPPTPTSSP